LHSARWTWMLVNAVLAGLILPQATPFFGGLGLAWVWDRSAGCTSFLSDRACDGGRLAADADCGRAPFPFFAVHPALSAALAPRRAICYNPTWN
jgi:hypothetical protein